MLRDSLTYDFVTGKSIKHIRRPAVSEEATYHLLCILFAEDKSGKAIIDSTDWRLFLWDGNDVSHALNRLSQKKWIRFEKGTCRHGTAMGSTVWIMEGANDQR